MYIIAVQYREDENNNYLVLSLTERKQWDEFLRTNLPDAICGYLIEKSGDLTNVPRLQVKKMVEKLSETGEVDLSEPATIFGLLSTIAVDYHQGLKTLMTFPAERRRASMAEAKEGKAPKAKKEKAAPAEKVGRVKKELREVPAFTDDTKIKVLVTENPRRPGTATYDIYNLYKDGITVADFVKAGGRRVDVKADYERGHIDFAA